MRNFLLVQLFLLFFLPSLAFPCTAVFISSQNKVLAGNNEDFWECGTKVWFKPGKDGKYGGVYFGFETAYAQGGMNEKGLFFDGFATAPYLVTKSLNKKVFKGNIIDKVMAECETVEQVIEIFSQYNLSFLNTAMLAFGDSIGDAVIIEGDAFIRKKGDYQIVTNFYQSVYKDPNTVPCDRYRIADAILKKNPEPSVALLRNILCSVHNEINSPTQYSNICDLKNKVIHFYHFHNFETPVTFDLMEELKKGEKVYDLPSLFPRNFAFEQFKKHRVNKQKEEIAKRRMELKDPKLLKDYKGLYYVTDKVYEGAMVKVTVKDNKLYLSSPGDDTIELIPENTDRFFNLGRYGSANFEFKRDEQNKVNGLTRELLGAVIHAKKKL